MAADGEKGRRRGRLPSIPIRIAIPGLLAILIIVAVGITAWLSYQNGERAANEEATALSRQVTLRIQAEVLSFLQTPQLVHAVNVAAVKSQDVDPSDLHALANHFWEQIRISQSAPYLYYADQRGSFVGYNTGYDSNGKAITVYKIEDQTSFPKRSAYQVDDSGKPVGQPIQVDTYDARQRPWYQTGAKAGKATWSPIYTFAAQHNLGISAVAPLYDANGKLQGVFGIDLTLVHLTDFLRNLKPSPNGRSFIVEPDGMLVATSSDEDPYRTETTQTNGNSVQQQVRINVKDSDDPLIRAAGDYLIRRFGGFNHIPFPNDVTGQIAPLPFVFAYQGQNELGEVATVTDNRGLNWLIVVVIPANDFMAGVYESIRNSVILGICVLIFAAALGSLLSMRIIRPVVTVIDVAAKIEQGKYDLEQLDPVAQRTDEMGQLARVFQRMANEVHSRERQLQRQVAQLKIEIDEAKRQTEVAQIVDSDVFKNLQERAQRLRERRNQTDPNRSN